MNNKNNIPVIKVNKTPIEIFGQQINSVTIQDDIKKQYCPYIKRTCTKPRKSEPHIKVGICSVGYKSDFMNSTTPVIICPHRLTIDSVFTELENLFFDNQSNISWANEVKMGCGGNVDYVALKYNDNSKDEVEDFLSVEIQTAGTTGSPYPAVKEIIEFGKPLKPTYKYGINWAGEFSKTMMQQIYKKGKIISEWNKDLVVVLQDVGMDYIINKSDTSELRDFNRNDNIHFITFKMEYINNKWELVISKKYSTNLSGINRIIAGNDVSKFIKPEQFIETAKSRIK